MSQQTTVEGGGTRQREKRYTVALGEVSHLEREGRREGGREGGKEKNLLLKSSSISVPYHFIEGHGSVIYQQMMTFLLSKRRWRGGEREREKSILAS